MADISTGRQRGIVPFVDETTGRLPDQYLPQGVIDLQGDLEQAVSDASASATAAKSSETAAKSSADSATQSASAATQSAESASGDAAAAKASAGEAASSASAAKASETAAASSATAAADSKAAAKASETAAAQSAQTATEQVSSIGDSVERAAASATAAQQSASQAQSNATAAGSAAQAAAASAESAQTAAESAASSKDAAAQSASQASESAQAAETSKTNAAASASAAEASKTNAASSASAAKISETNAAASATAAQQAVDGFGLEVGTTTTGEPGTDAAVSIAKQGTKYVADFTIPRGPKGDPGDLTTVAHDSTLTGDGTSGAPLGVADTIARKSELEQSINSFKAIMSETYTTKKELDNLKIGSTNLILNSKPDSSGEYFFKNANSVVAGEYAEITLSGGVNRHPNKQIPLDSYTFYKSGTDVGFDNGDEFVFSFDYMITARTNASKDVMSEFWIGIRNAGNGYYSNLITAEILTAFTTSELNTWQRYSRYIKVSRYRSDVAIEAAMQCNWKTGEGSITFRLRNVKLERGAKATDWSPAPEDFDVKYTSKTEFKQTLLNYVPLSTYRTLEARVQALEAKLANK